MFPKNEFHPYILHDIDESTLSEMIYDINQQNPSIYHFIKSYESVTVRAMLIYLILRIKQTNLDYLYWNPKYLKNNPEFITFKQSIEKVLKEGANKENVSYWNYQIIDRFNIPYFGFSKTTLITSNELRELIKATETYYFKNFVNQEDLIQHGNKKFAEKNENGNNFSKWFNTRIQIIHRIFPPIYILGIKNGIDDLIFQDYCEHICNIWDNYLTIVNTLLIQNWWKKKLYQPNGILYKKAKSHFESLQFTL